MWDYGSALSEPRYLTELSSQLHALSTLNPQKSNVSILQEVRMLKRSVEGEKKPSICRA
jgi:hypothetical protein